MKPSLRQLQYLVAIAETGTMSEAAIRTNVSQPSLSIQVKDMEDQIGAPLVERSRKGTYLTPLGEEFVIRARIILRQVEDLKSLARESGGSLAGRVRLGVLPTVGPYLLPQATRKLHAAYPELRLNVREERTVDLHTHLSDGRFDMIISTPEDHPGTQSFPLLQENIYICVAPDDELAQRRGSIALEDLEGRVFLTLGYGHKFTTVVKNLATKAGASTNANYEGTSLDAIRQMASMGGRNIAILPSLYAISEAKRDPDLFVRPIAHPLARRHISLMWRESSPMSAKFKTLGAVFEQIAKDIMS